MLMYLGRFEHTAVVWVLIHFDKPSFRYGELPRTNFRSTMLPDGGGAFFHEEGMINNLHLFCWLLYS